MQKLPLETQTLYAELMEHLTALEARRTIGRLSGCFTTKTVKGESYYYFQYSDPGGASRQIYVGKKTPSLDSVVERYRVERGVLRTDSERIERLCALVRTGGALVADAASARVLRALAESGAFHLGAVLVGTHAFAVLGNLLGVRWEAAALKTHDIDIASETVMRVAMPRDFQADVPGILERLEMGFLPVPQLDRKSPSTPFKVRGQALRVDILAPAEKGKEEKPVLIRRLNAAAQPVPFLDYLIEGSERGAVVDGGGVLVNVPAPARFAFHKLIVSQVRGLAMHGKAEKDMLQAAQVFSALAEERPGDLLLAWDGIAHRGRNWERPVRAGLGLLRKRHPQEYEMLVGALPNLKGN